MLNHDLDGDPMIMGRVAAKSPQAFSPDRGQADSHRHVTEAAIDRPMNPLDALMLAVNRALRLMGLPGFETQTLIWLDGRVDINRLRAAIVRLGRRYPITTARLVDDRRAPFWRSRSGADASLREVTLEATSLDAVLAEAARLLSAVHDLTADDPIRFVLLHLADGRDVFLMQYNHTLMDNNAAVPVIRELDRLSEPAADTDENRDESRDAMGEYLRQSRLERRLRSAWRVADHRLRTLRFRPVILGSADSTVSQPGPFRVLSRTLEAGQSSALHARVIEVCRWPGVSMAVLGSAFRSIDRLAHDRDERQSYVAGIGVDLGLRSTSGPHFQNLVSLFPIAARREDLADLDSLTRILNRQLRDQLMQDADLGLLELSRIFCRFPQFFGRTIHRLLRDNYSLWYGYFGSSDAAGERFCGTDITAVRYVGPSWPPAGLTLLVNQSRGKTHLQTTYLPNAVPDALAHDFLDAVVEDLARFAARACEPRETNAVGPLECAESRRTQVGGTTSPRPS